MTNLSDVHESEQARMRMSSLIMSIADLTILYAFSRLTSKSGMSDDQSPCFRSHSVRSVGRLPVFGKSATRQRSQVNSKAAKVSDDIGAFDMI